MSTVAETDDLQLRGALEALAEAAVRFAGAAEEAEMLTRRQPRRSRTSLDVDVKLAAAHLPQDGRELTAADVLAEVLAGTGLDASEAARRGRLVAEAADEFAKLGRLAPTLVSRVMARYQVSWTPDIERRLRDADMLGRQLAGARQLRVPTPRDSDTSALRYDLGAFIAAHRAAQHYGDHVAHLLVAVESLLADRKSEVRVVPASTARTQAAIVLVASIITLLAVAPEASVGPLSPMNWPAAVRGVFASTAFVAVLWSALGCCSGRPDWSKAVWEFFKGKFGG